MTCYRDGFRERGVAPSCIFENKFTNNRLSGNIHSFGGGGCFFTPRPPLSLEYSLSIVIVWMLESDPEIFTSVLTTSSQLQSHPKGK